MATDYRMLKFTTAREGAVAAMEARDRAACAATNGDMATAADERETAERIERYVRTHFGCGASEENSGPCRDYAPEPAFTRWGHS